MNYIDNCDYHHDYATESVFVCFFTTYTKFSSFPMQPPTLAYGTHLLPPDDYSIHVQ